jgi:hypothetical protein
MIRLEALARAGHLLILGRGGPPIATITIIASVVPLTMEDFWAARV